MEMIIPAVAVLLVLFVIGKLFAPSGGADDLDDNDDF